MEDRLWPQNGDHFYWVRSDIGDVCEGTWIDSSPSCEFRRSIGNVFRSMRDARIAIARQQARVEDKEVAKK